MDVAIRFAVLGVTGMRSNDALELGNVTLEHHPVVDLVATVLATLFAAGFQILADPAFAAADPSQHRQ